MTLKVFLEQYDGLSLGMTGVSAETIAMLKKWLVELLLRRGSESEGDILDEIATKECEAMADSPKSQESEFAHWCIRNLKEKNSLLQEDVTFWKGEAETAQRYSRTLEHSLETMKKFLKEVNDINERQTKEIEELKKEAKNAGRLAG